MRRLDIGMKSTHWSIQTCLPDICPMTSSMDGVDWQKWVGRNRMGSTDSKRRLKKTLHAKITYNRDQARLPLSLISDAFSQSRHS